MGIEAVIFDMDGVLTDSEDMWQQNEKDLFSAIGIELTPAHLEESRGLRAEEMVALWISRFSISGEDPHKLRDKYDSLMLEKMKTVVPIMEGAREALDYIKSKGLPMALASNSTMEQIRAIVERFGFESYFEILLTGVDMEAGKPHPAIYLESARRMNKKPELCLAIEDSYFGMKSALAAGMKVIVLPDPKEYEQTRFDAADKKIRSLNEINDQLLEELQRTEKQKTLY